MKNYNKIKDWYDSEYKEKQENFGFSIDAYKHFLNYLGIHNSLYDAGSKFLDVACGQGYMLKLAEERLLNTFGIDISIESCELSKKNAPNSVYHECSAEELFFENDTFDYMTCIGSLEHFLNINKSLQEMHRTGKDTCKYCILVPNKNSWFNNVTEQKEINEDLHTLKEWKQFFINNNFKIIKIYRDKWHWEKPQSLLKKFLNWIAPLQYSNSLVFMLGKLCKQ